MDSESDPVVSCENQDRIIGRVNQILPKLPQELRVKLDEIKIAMIQHIGKEGMFICLNGKSVKAIIAEYAHVFKPQQRAGGTDDGVSFQLFEAPTKKITIDEFGRPTNLDL